MNKYQELYMEKSWATCSDSISSESDNPSSWEDAYWLSKILMTGEIEVSDEKIINLLEYSFFMGLSISNKDIFFDANESLAKLYIRYGMYSEASSKLMLLAYNFSCPDWVHIYLATTQLYTTFERIVEEPKYFFDRLSQIDNSNSDSKKEVRTVFAKYLCLIVENNVDGLKIADKEIVKYAEQIYATATDEFRLFHQSICPNLEYKVLGDNTEELEATKRIASRAQEEAIKARQEAEQSRTEATNAKKSELEAIKAAREANEKARKSETEAQTSKEAEKAARISAEIARGEAEKYKSAELLARQKAEQLENEKSELAKRLQELEHAKQTSIEPQNIDDVFLKMTTWLNVSLRRYLAQWLTRELSKNCKNDFWNKKVKKSLQYKELEKFDSYRELTDFAIDALLNIYYNNLDDFYSCNCMAKTNDRERIQEMQQIRNRWVGHFEENSWTKEKILFDIDTIIEFVGQIEMPNDKQKEYREFRLLVTRMS